MCETVVGLIRQGEPVGRARCRGHGTGDPLSGDTLRLP